MDNAPQTNRPSPLRSFRDHQLLWSVAFLIFAGPLNPAAWLWGRPVDGYLILVDYPTMAWIVLMPCTVMALVMQNMMWSMPVFLPRRIWVSACVGLLLAIIAGPIGFSLAGVTAGVIGGTDAMNFLFASVTFGVLFGVIPYFAMAFGLPCMLAAVLLAFLSTKPAFRPAPTQAFPNT